MDSIIKTFPLSFLLRSGFAGTFFVLSFWVANQDIFQCLNLQHSTLIAGGMLIALLSGVTLYCLHRSLLYPFFEWGFNATWASDIRNCCPLISDNTIEVLEVLWSDGEKPCEKLQGRMKHIRRWADYTHLQYVSALCFGIDSLDRDISIDKQMSRPPYWPLIILAAFFVVAALVSDWRLHRVRETFRTTKGGCA